MTRDTMTTTDRPAQLLGLHDAARLGLLIGVWVGGVGLAGYSIWFYFSQHGVGQDAHAYWLTAYRTKLYGAPPNSQDAYLYSPAFAQLIRPIALLPWPAFVGIWMAAESAAFAWLLKPIGWVWGIPLFLLCLPEVLLANVIGFVATAAVLGLRRPGFWAVPALAKISPGAMGAAWFAVRGQWSSLLIAAAWSAGIVAASAAIWPMAWVDWVQFLTTSGTGHGLLLRTAAALVLVGVAARRGWIWLIPFTLVLATPVLVGSQCLAYLAAVVRLRRMP